jgi:hypothetical protein
VWRKYWFDGLRWQCDPWPQHHAVWRDALTCVGAPSYWLSFVQRIGSHRRCFFGWFTSTGTPLFCQAFKSGNYLIYVVEVTPQLGDHSLYFHQSSSFQGVCAGSFSALSGVWRGPWCDKNMARHATRSIRCLPDIGAIFYQLGECHTSASAWRETFSRPVVSSSERQLTDASPCRCDSFSPPRDPSRSHLRSSAIACCLAWIASATTLQGHQVFHTARDLTGGWTRVARRKARRCAGLRLNCDSEQA